MALKIDLRAAVRANNVQAIRDYVRAGGDATAEKHSTDKEGSLLHVAVRKASADMVHLLVTTAKLSPNITDKFGETPLMYACREGRLKAVMYLVAYGAKVNVSGTLSGPLHAAVEYNHADIVDFLLSQPGLDINAQTLNDRQSALHVASEQGNTRLVSLLLRHGARLDVKDWRGRLPADVSKNVEVRALLAKHKLDEATRSLSTSATRRVSENSQSSDDGVSRKLSTRSDQLLYNNKHLSTASTNSSSSTDTPISEDSVPNADVITANTEVSHSSSTCNEQAILSAEYSRKQSADASSQCECENFNVETAGTAAFTGLLDQGQVTSTIQTLTARISLLEQCLTHLTKDLDAKVACIQAYEVREAQLTQENIQLSAKISQLQQVIDNQGTT